MAVQLRYALQIGLSLVRGAVPDRTKRVKFDKVFGQTFWNEFDVLPTSDPLNGTIVSLGGLLKPRLLMVYGDTGIAFSVGDSTEMHDADPIAIVSKSDGIEMSTNQLMIVNSSTQPVKVTVVALQ